MRMAVYKLRLLLPKLLIHSKSISRSMRKKSHEFASFSLIHSFLYGHTLEENT